MDTQKASEDVLNKNRNTAVKVVCVVAAMLALSFASVPLYKIFCQITGFDGTTKRADFAPGTVLDRKITIRFDATTAKDLPWDFKPGQVSQELHLGETGLAYYTSENLSDQPIIGSATYNVQPAKVGEYFRKIACFCFTEQLLEPGQKVDMPMTFFIDPEMVHDKSLDDVTTVTISYTFYRNDKAEAEKLAALAE